MNQSQDLITLDDNLSSTTPPPNYPNAFSSNRQNPNQAVYSTGLNQNIPPVFQNTNLPQAQSQYQQPIQYQSGIPVVDIDKLPLSMKRNFHIQNNYPTGFVVFHSLSLLLFALLMIATEIIILNISSNKDLNNQIGGGLYSGGFLILTVFLNLLSISCRNFCMIISSVLLHLLSLSLTFIMTVVLHAIAIGDSDCTFDQEECLSNRLFICGIIQIGLGLVVVIMCLFYSIFIQIRVVGGCSRKSQNSRQFVPILPNPQYNYSNPNYSYQRQ
ncbi:hypothetical protein BpHYR1_034066 [Brachionus plicatilis]|uniref:Uncharacterized protein n=1 Tax=Brachionus plicatilis TaxID=10195 RepID=A0A3M7R8P6_BRAPC|nr:hypothetical protein BpHYR1_034066 [Brachionus plicatilis]